MLSPEGHSQRPKWDPAIPGLCHWEHLARQNTIQGVTEGYGQSKPRGVTADSRDAVKVVASGQVERWGKGLPHGAGGGGPCECRLEAGMSSCSGTSLRAQELREF